MNTPLNFHRPFLSILPCWAPMAASLLALAPLPARADWPNTNATKFVQMPDLTPNGMDIFFGNSPTILADDFICTNTGPISDIHLWISSLQNAPTTGGQFELSIWSDVPASPAGQPSHPGQRLWAEVFPPGQYQVVAPWATNLQEQFWNLDATPPQLLGPDNTLFQYNFYPKAPFTQTGSAAAPTIYWLGVSMVNNQPPQGWKTSPDHLAPDDAALGHYQPGTTTVTDWKELRDPRSTTSASLSFSFALTTLQPTNPCPLTVTCFLDRTVECGSPWDFNPPRVSSSCCGTNITVTVVSTITNGVCPQVITKTWLIADCNGTTNYCHQTVTVQDTTPPTLTCAPSKTVDCGVPWTFDDPTASDACCTNVTVSILSTVTNGVCPLSPMTITRTWLATDCCGNTNTCSQTVTVLCCPPPPCPDTNAVKFVQLPQVNNGLDVLASGAPGAAALVLADDFPCTNTGPITDIHLWGSWLGDQVDLNPTFWLGIYSDVPASTTGPSHPGALLWQQFFGPGQYSEGLAATGQEQFFDPTKSPPVIGLDTQVYYYCFFPTNPFVQKGSASAPTVYWLSVHAQPSVAGALFGWKTSTNRFQDDAVWGQWSGGPPTSGWQELVDPAGISLNLAFKLTTASNPCPVTVLCFLDRTVECGSTWDFNPPRVSSNCCGTNITVSVVSTVTNGVCPQAITRTWAIVDCNGTTQFCHQTITVVDTTPPVLTCANSKTVDCGVSWTFDPPTASDACCTGVTVSVLSTVTNGVCPQPLAVTRTWLATDCCGNTNTCSQTITVLCCPPVSTNKWVQYPDLLNGLDVLATQPAILADDFLCTNAGPITNIQVWGSWLKDAVDTNVQFTLAIWSDVPPPAAGGFSHPGRLLWSAVFGPADYTSALSHQGDERFFDPNPAGTGGILGPDTQIWWYNFNPKQPFCQQGSAKNPVVYWLSVSATTATNLFGWKTSTNHFKDDAVFGHVSTSGVPLGDWRDLHDPATGISLDLSFLLNNGPPTVDCEPVLRPKFVQWPDSTPNGLDVRATAPKILGDDFFCRIPGQINGITVWGSWLNDVVDTNAQFQLGLWTDVPGVPGTTNFSHPGDLLCTALFVPPQTVGTSLLRYQYRLDAANLRETFFDPDLPPPGGFIGNDTQIWRYDFYPFVPSCWRQRGLPCRPLTYWLSVSALTDTNKFLFGWKTSTNHWMDDGVYGHLDPNLNPLRDWKDLHDPRNKQSLDLAFALRSFPVIGINKDLKNTTSLPASCIEIVVAGLHEITWHYDGTPPWPNFQVTYVGGNTVLRWCGNTLLPGQITHVGFEMTGASLTIVSMHWLDAAGNAIGPAIQVGHHMLGNGTTLQLINNIVGAAVMFQGGTAEVYSNSPPSLDQMVLDGNRTPMATFPLPAQPMLIPDGGMDTITIPPSLIPDGAQFLLFITDLAPASAAGGPGGPKPNSSTATTDFVLLPLDTALRPAIEEIDASGDSVMITWTSVSGRTYRLQSKPAVDGAAWTDLGDVVASDADTSSTVPVGGTQSYYRVVLLPE